MDTLRALVEGPALVDMSLADSRHSLMEEQIFTDDVPWAWEERSQAWSEGQAPADDVTQAPEGRPLADVMLAKYGPVRLIETK